MFGTLAESKWVCTAGAGRARAESAGRGGQRDVGSAVVKSAGRAGAGLL